MAANAEAPLEFRHDRRRDDPDVDQDKRFPLRRGLGVALSHARERLLARLRTRKGRAREGLVLVEGPRAIAAALSSRAQVRFVLVEEGGQLPEVLSRSLADASLEVVRVTAEAMAGLADTHSPQGILAVVEEPLHPLPYAHGTHDAPPHPHRILTLDALQDPGNAGTLIRTAVAFGVDAVVALEGTVDPWNPKTVRASAGEAFRVPIYRMESDAFLAWHRVAQFTLVVADPSGLDVRQEPFFFRRMPRSESPPGTGSGQRKGASEGDGPVISAPTHWAVVVGNEGAGPRPELLAAADRVLALPLAAGVESLNAAVAGAILLWELGPAHEPAADPRSTPPKGPPPPTHEKNRTAS